MPSTSQHGPGAELEIKLALPTADPASLARQLARLPALARRKPVRKQVDNIYFDTPAQALRAQRMALRLRRVGGRAGLGHPAGPPGPGCHPAVARAAGDVVRQGAPGADRGASPQPRFRPPHAGRSPAAAGPRGVRGPSPSGLDIPGRRRHGICRRRPGGLRRGIAGRRAHPGRAAGPARPRHRNPGSGWKRGSLDQGAKLAL